MIGVRGRAARAGVHLLLGGVIALPVAGLVWLLALAADGTVGWLVLVALAVAGVVVVAQLPVVRPLAVLAARTLLDVPLPDPDPAASRTRQARARGAGWLALQAVLGSLTVLAVLVLAPTAVGTVDVAVSGSPIRFSDTATWRPTGALRVLAPVAGLACLAVLGALVVVLGVASRRWAPWFLGPTPAERLALARAEAAREARRARLAGELHDGIGHVLTAVTLQAGAARRVFDTDPEFARRALAAIEERGRAAVADLDRVLGSLRPDDAVVGADDLDDLAEGLRTAGIEVSIRRAGEPTGERAATVHAIAREALTNAARHSSGGPVEVDVAVVDDGVRLVVTNPGAPGVTREGGGHGLAGLRRRAEALGGTLDAGPEDGRWVVRAYLP